MTRTLVAALGAVLLLGAGLSAQDFSQYRTFQLKSNVAAVSTALGLGPEASTTLYQQPALLQKIEWRASIWGAASGLPSTDPVEQMTFSFYNDQLFQIVVAYRRTGTAGMTDADMTEALSEVYGARAPRLIAGHVPSFAEQESGTLVSRWGNATHRVVLYRSESYRAGTPGELRLIVSDVALERLATTAIARAERQYELDAPRRELARQKAELTAEREALEKARGVNKQVFQP